MIDEDKHHIDINTLVTNLTNNNLDDYLTQGLTKQLISQNAKKYGKNTFSLVKKQPILVQIYHVYTQPINLLLFFASLMSLVIYVMCPDDVSSLYLALGIFFVSCANTAIEFYQEYTTNTLLEGFRKMIPTKCRVIRDGQFVDINASEMVVGDLVYFKLGDKVAADIRILQENNLKIDNSSITGESLPIRKNIDCSEKDIMHARNMLLSGNLIVDGDGKGIVVSVGDSTVLGKIANLTLTKEHSKSELTEEIETYVKKLGIIAVFTSLIFYSIARINGYTVYDNLALCIGIFIAFVPQGLPATVTILMTISAKSLAKNNVLVKDLRAVETLGSISLLATDKTGTLTQGKMTCTNVWDGSDITIINASNREHLQYLANFCTMTSKVIITDKLEVLGDPTEIALFNFGLQYSDVTEHKLVKQTMFNSDTKYQTSVFDIDNDHYIIILKGAPERVLALCTEYKKNNVNILLDNDFRYKFNEMYKKLAGKGQRIIAIAEKIISKIDYLTENTNINDLCFVALIGLVDPPKHGVKDAIMKLRLAGIQTIMVTGDHPLTAEYIARQTCILSHNTSSIASLAEIISGDKLDNFTKNDWQRVLSKKELVFARTTPKQKLLIVEKFQEIGHIVGVCGDGVNDSPALKKSNLGISMNKTGSEVSKEAASMIILDDNFSSIVNGVLEGRLIFCNLKKSIRYIISHITPQVVPYLLFVGIGIPSPMSTLLLMFIDLFTEFFPAVFLAYEEPESNIMLENPRKIDKISVNAIYRDDAKTAFDHYDEYKDKQIIEHERNKAIDDNIGKTIIPAFNMISNLKTVQHGQKLCDLDLISWSYMEAGLLITLGAIISFFTVLVKEGIPSSHLIFSSHIYFKHGSPDMNANRVIPHNVQREILYKAQSAYFMSILIGQCFNLLTCKRKEIFDRKLFRNMAPLLGSVFGLVFGYLIVYTTVCNKYLYSRPVELSYFIAPVVTGMGLVVWDTMRRVLRKRYCFGKMSDIDTMYKIRRAKFSRES